MASVAEKTLRKDLKKIYENPPPGVSVGLISDNNLLEWKAVICGPENTPFEGGTFKLKLIFPPDYPSKPPTVWFFSLMFHPNVYKNGRICLDILEEPEKWLPSYDVASVLYGIQSMLGDPNPQSPANGLANRLFQQDKTEYEKKVQEIVLLSESTLTEDRDDENMENLNIGHYEEEAEMEELLNALAIEELENTPDLA